METIFQDPDTKLTILQSALVAFSTGGASLEERLQEIKTTIQLKFKNVQAKVPVMEIKTIKQRQVINQFQNDNVTMKQKMVV